MDPYSEFTLGNKLATLPGIVTSYVDDSPLVMYTIFFFKKIKLCQCTMFLQEYIMAKIALCFSSKGQGHKINNLSEKTQKGENLFKKQIESCLQ